MQMMIQKSELQSKLNPIKKAITLKSIAVTELQKLPIYLTDDFVYFIGLAQISSRNKLKLISKLFPNTSDVRGFFYLNLSDVDKALSFFEDSIIFEFSEDDLTLSDTNDALRTVNIELGRQKLLRPSLSIALDTLGANMVDKLSEVENPVEGFSESFKSMCRTMLKFKTLDTTDTASTIMFSPKDVSAQQFNYVSSLPQNYGFSGKIPTGYLEVVYSAIQNRESDFIIHNVEAKNEVLEFLCGEDLYISLDLLSPTSIGDVDTLVPNKETSATFNTQQILNISKIMTKFADNLGCVYLEILESGTLVFKNSLSASKTNMTALKKLSPIDVGTTVMAGVFSIPIKVLSGIISLSENETISLTLSADIDNPLLFISDERLLNVIALDSYSD